jgi:hypothetical protein
MKVLQLIKKLSKLNPDAEVLVATDEEGNFYHKLGDIYAPYDLKFFEYDGINLCTEEDIIDEDMLKEMDEKEQFMDGILTQKEYDKFKSCVVIFPK